MMAEDSFFLLLLICTLLGSIMYCFFLVKEVGSIIIRAYTELYGLMYKERIPRDSRKRIPPQVFFSISFTVIILIKGLLWNLELSLQENIQMIINPGIFMIISLTFIYLIPNTSMLCIGPTLC